MTTHLCAQSLFIKLVDAEYDDGQLHVEIDAFSPVSSLRGLSLESACQLNNIGPAVGAWLTGLCVLRIDVSTYVGIRTCVRRYNVTCMYVLPACVLCTASLRVLSVLCERYC